MEGDATGFVDSEPIRGDSYSDAQSNGSGVKVTSTPPTVIVT